MASTSVTAYVVGGLVTIIGILLVSYPIIVKLIDLHQYHHKTTGSQTGAWEGIIKDPLVFPFSISKGKSENNYLGINVTVNKSEKLKTQPTKFTKILNIEWVSPISMLHRRVTGLVFNIYSILTYIKDLIS